MIKATIFKVMENIMTTMNMGISKGLRWVMAMMSISRKITTLGH